jgi:hypothetical protein
MFISAFNKFCGTFGILSMNNLLNNVENICPLENTTKKQWSRVINLAEQFEMTGFVRILNPSGDLGPLLSLMRAIVLEHQSTVVVVVVMHHLGKKKILGYLE